MRKNVISVIIPVYKVERYLQQCLDSVLSQDHAQLEVILIDDGSPDASGEICDRYALQDSRVRVIHQQNGGGAAAKNAGLRIASGEYLSFVDSDDYLEPNVYSYMVAVLTENQADVIRCGFRNVFRGRETINPYPAGRTVMEGKEFLRSFATDWTGGLLWNKLYKRELFEGVFFEEGRKVDDEYFTYRGIMNARKVVCDDKVIYNYRKRASGVMASPESKLQLSFDRVDFMEKRRKIIASRFPELQRDFDISFVDALTYLPDYPDNDVKSIYTYRDYGKKYFLTPGNTFPPRYLLRGLLRLYLTPAKKLVEQAKSKQSPVNLEEFFP